MSGFFLFLFFSEWETDKGKMLGNISFFLIYIGVGETETESINTNMHTV